MNCPECHVQLSEFNIGDDVLKECRVCRGLWFEQGQLDAVHDDVLPEMGWVDMDRLKDRFDFKTATDVLFCPRCQNIALTKFRDQNSKAEFCICTQCQGTWLATGQFLSLINLLLEEANKKTASELAVISLQQVKELLTDSNAMISEWQDLKSVLALLKKRIFVENPKLKSIIVGLQKSLPL
jgi:Zn-finger nucleic acid-binding protein